MVEKSYFDTIDDALAEKAHLSNYLLPHNEVYTCAHTHISQSISTNEADHLKQEFVSIATTDLGIL